MNLPVVLRIFYELSKKMDSPVTATMSTSRNLKILHLEPTDVCQARCPLCARETDLTFNKHRQHHLTVDQILEHVTEDDIRALDKVFMCGNYGDPAAGKRTAEIFQYFRQVNPDITLGMNTNGAIQTTFWWHAMGQLFNQPRDYVVFSIDGLENTNLVYRVGVNWDKLMSNAEAFIAAGGSAHWDMLVYRHNEHQVNACEQLARDMGFKWFRAKVSKRPVNNFLEMPIKWQPPNVQRGDVVCHALKEQSMYIDARGRASPCCWLTDVKETEFSTVQQSWLTDAPNKICVSTCASCDNQTNFTGQWQREVELS
jgi:MoaA/NifB/PqqE/SkfB family radical SAM enzyme